MVLFGQHLDDHPASGLHARCLVVAPEGPKESTGLAVAISLVLAKLQHLSLVDCTFDPTDPTARMACWTIAKCRSDIRTLVSRSLGGRMDGREWTVESVVRSRAATLCSLTLDGAPCGLADWQTVPLMPALRELAVNVTSGAWALAALRGIVGRAATMARIMIEGVGVASLHPIMVAIAPVRAQLRGLILHTAVQDAASSFVGSVVQNRVAWPGAHPHCRTRLDHELVYMPNLVALAINDFGMLRPGVIAHHLGQLTHFGSLGGVQPQQGELFGSLLRMIQIGRKMRALHVAFAPSLMELVKVRRRHRATGADRRRRRARRGALSTRRCR